MLELHELSATEVLAAFEGRELSPVEYLEALIRRAEAVEAEINAFGDTYFEEALQAARRAEVVYSSRSRVPRPLEGLPVAVKDEAEIGGKRTTNGSLLLQDHIAEADEPMVERLLAAGAIVHARTLTPEFSITFWTSSRLWGVTRNPWNLEYDVGGSSGGSAAALAAGTTPLATGSDIGGSIRVPASCCGVVGYKPAYGRIPQLPPDGLDHWCHLGPLARTVVDAALLADTLVGPDARDHASLRPALRIGHPTGDVAGIRIAVSQDLGDWPVVESVRSAVRTTADVLRDLGAVVEEVPLRIERSLLATAGNAHYAAIFAAYVAEMIEGKEDLANPYTRTWLASLDDAPTLLQGLAAEGEITRRLGDTLDRFDALLCPTMAIPAYRAGVDYCAEPVVIDGVNYDGMREVCLSEVFNPAGRCPVITLPAGRDPAGVPIGLQIVGRSYEDLKVFAIAAALEAAQPWPHIAPPRSRDI
ncbi:MAG: amidase [Deltaproteobacteria bacterium]|nr:amidase [Deltaproteobacteria bacterium]MBW2418128.1 amidase [Deltaproteobacteria bacterium]